MTRPTIRIMVVEDLGYCCPYSFFSLYRQTALIAARLGVTTRAVKYHKQMLRSGQYVCEGKANCLKGKCRAKRF